MKKWIALIGALALLIVMDIYMSRGSIDDSSQTETQSPPVKQAPVDKDKATMQPGRVVELITTKGKITFILLEKDCPKTTARIASLVESGEYNDIMFPRVEDWIIQTASAKHDVPGIGIETKKGLTHATGAVGMARRGNDYNSNTSVFYILKKPQFALDGKYTVFGRLISGMDVVLKITSNDYIISSKIHQPSQLDTMAYFEALKSDLKTSKSNKNQEDRHL